MAHSRRMIRVYIIRDEAPALYRAALAWGEAGIIMGGAHPYRSDVPGWALWPSPCAECGRLPLAPAHLAAERRRSARSAALQRPRKWTGPENAGE